MAYWIVFIYTKMNKPFKNHRLYAIDGMTLNSLFELVVAVKDMRPEYKRFLDSVIADLIEQSTQEIDEIEEIPLQDELKESDLVTFLAELGLKLTSKN